MDASHQKALDQWHSGIAWPAGAAKSRMPVGHRGRIGQCGCREIEGAHLSQVSHRTVRVPRNQGCPPVTWVASDCAGAAKSRMPADHKGRIGYCGCREIFNCYILITNSIGFLSTFNNVDQFLKVFQKVNGYIYKVGQFSKVHFFTF